MFIESAIKLAKKTYPSFSHGVFISKSAFNLVMHGQVMATISEELPPDSVMLLYLSASGFCQFYVTTIITEWLLLSWISYLHDYPCREG